MPQLKKIGLAILGLCLGILTVYGLYSLLMDIWNETSLHLVLRLAIIGAILGTIVILFGLIIERVRDARKEKEL